MGESSPNRLILTERSFSMFRLAIALTCVVTLLASSAYANQDERDLSGKYRCVGTTENGAKYTGEVVIKKVNKGYKIEWVVKNRKYTGIGFVDEDRLSVAWTVNTPNGVVLGVIAFKIKKDGSLVGKWIDPSLKEIYDETLIPIHDNLI